MTYMALPHLGAYAKKIWEHLVNKYSECVIIYCIYKKNLKYSGSDQQHISPYARRGHIWLFKSKIPKLNIGGLWPPNDLWLAQSQPCIYGRPKAAKISLAGPKGQSDNYYWSEGPTKDCRTHHSVAANGIWDKLLKWIPSNDPLSAA
ncbi:unnamed protein product [Meganyctiphanes norvegica]|uniref:Uncharacterized protein n=1 Tax=Meganyctiphanes norvegica TaxID=48144 RepID=A0AAV2QXX5_MEGNR